MTRGSRREAGCPEVLSSFGSVRVRLADALRVEHVAAGLRADDVIEQAGGMPVAGLEDLKRARAAAEGKAWWVLLVRRRGQTMFVEINLKPAKSK